MTLLLTACAAVRATSVQAGEGKPITHDGKRKMAPVFIDADHVAFVVHEVPNQVVLKRLDLTTSAEEVLHPGMAAHQFDPAYSRDGRWHCYALSATSPQLVLVIQDLVEGEESTFRPLEARATARSPTISPEGDRVVFSLSDVDGHQIASVDMKGGDLRRLTDSAGINAAPAFSPDGRQIAFSSSRERDFDLYIMDADGANVRRLVSAEGLDTRPAWSPDGSKIAFTSNRDGNYEIYCVDADGGNLRRLTQNDRQDDFPAWHPDGDKLLMVSNIAGRLDLVLLDVDDTADTDQ